MDETDVAVVDDADVVVLLVVFDVVVVEPPDPGPEQLKTEGPGMV